ncbi:MAG: hypothetical protein ACRDRR_16195 [Pseudonocardiaceae bacterium]
MMYGPAPPACYVLGGEVAWPAGDVPEPFVDSDDIADVAVMRGCGLR